MSNLRRLLRVSSALALVIVTSALTACSDMTGPNTRRSGFITSASAVEAVVPSGGTSLTPVPGTRKATNDSTSTNSGYNVTAF